MRLLIISNYFFPEIGAAPNRIYNMADALSEKHNVEVICPLPNYPYGKIIKGYRRKLWKKEWLNNIKVFRYFIYPSKSKNVVLRILSMLSFSICLWLSCLHLRKIRSIDAVIIQNSPLLVSFSSIILFKKFLRRKIMLNVSDLWPDSALDLGYVKKGRFFNLLKKIEQFNYRNSIAILGQSQEILNHIKEEFSETPMFLYRNVQPQNKKVEVQKKRRFSIVYAGLLGVAQGILEILNNIEFKTLDIQFDIYGDGAEKDDILKLIEAKSLKNVSYKGIVSKKELNSILPSYHFALVPLTTHIKGAVPSKIFEFVGSKVPVVFMGSGEAAIIINDNNLGFSIVPKAYKELQTVIEKISAIDASEYKKLEGNCELASIEKLNFNKQIIDFNAFLNQNI